MRQMDAGNLAGGPVDKKLQSHNTSAATERIGGPFESETEAMQWIAGQPDAGKLEARELRA